MMTPLEARLTKENEALRQENKILREKIDLLARRVFGASSEKMDTDQLLLALEGAEAKKPEASSDALAALEAEPEKTVKPTRKGKKKGGITDELLDSLPAVEVVLVPEEVQAEPEAYRLVDEVVTKQLDYQPPRYVCNKIIRQRFARIDAPQCAPIIAELPTMLERSKAGPGLLASILTAKYCLRSSGHAVRLRKGGYRYRGKALRSPATLPPTADRQMAARHRAITPGHVALGGVGRRVAATDLSNHPRRRARW
jgi:transposase